MIKYEIDTKQEDQPEHTMKLKFSKETSGRILITGICKSGMVWSLASFTEDGHLALHSGLMDNLGFQLDRAGRIIVDKA